MAGTSGEDYDLSENIRENFNPKKKWQDTIRLIKATNKFKMAGAAKPEPLDTDSDSDGGFKTADEDDERVKKTPGSAGGDAGLAGLVQQMKVKE